MGWGPPTQKARRFWHMGLRPRSLVGHVSLQPTSPIRLLYLAFALRKCNDERKHAKKRMTPLRREIYRYNAERFAEGEGLMSQRRLAELTGFDKTTVNWPLPSAGNHQGLAASALRQGPSLPGRGSGGGCVVGGVSGQVPVLGCRSSLLRIRWRIPASCGKVPIRKVPARIRVFLQERQAFAVRLNAATGPQHPKVEGSNPSGRTGGNTTSR